MKDFIKTTFPPPILEEECDKCISIYMPTHRTAPDNRQDALRFKNIINDLENKGDFKSQVAKLKELEKSLEFWMHNLDGLAILMNKEDMNIYRLPRPVQQHVAVGQNYYLLPLIRNYQSDHRYYALGLSRDSFRLYSGNRYGYREVEIPKEERLLEHVLGDEQDSPHVNVVYQGGSVVGFHGYSTKSDAVKIDTERFFDYVDEYIIDNYTKDTKIPLILISLQEHQGTFRNISKNPYLLDAGVVRSYESININDLKDYLWEVLEPIYNKKTDDLIKQFNVGINNNEATNTLQTTLEAILENRVRVLVLESDKSILGKVDVDNATYELNDDGEDILNHLALLALGKGSEVIILPKEKMPEHLSVFSILRY